MKILSDEDAIWDELMQRLSELGSEYECTFVSWPHRYRNRRIGDEEVPEICRCEGATALLTLNYKDFGRHQVYYQALLSAGVSLIVLRQPNPITYTPDVDYQVELVRPHLRNIVRRLERADEPLSFVINKSGIRTNPLQDLIARFPT
jgi:hypothetical protein